MKLSNKDVYLVLLAICCYSLVLAFVDSLLVLKFICGLLFGSTIMINILYRKLTNLHFLLHKEVLEFIHDLKSGNVES